MRRRKPKRSSMAGRRAHLLASVGCAGPARAASLNPKPMPKLGSAGNGHRRRTLAAEHGSNASAQAGTCSHPRPTVCNGRLAFGGMPVVRIFNGLAASASISRASKGADGGHFRRFRSERRRTRSTPPIDEDARPNTGYRFIGFSPHRRPTTSLIGRSGGSSFKAA